MPQLISGPIHDGQANYEFKPWVIIGPQSTPASEAALAAGEQDHFFNYMELFYRNQGQENSGYVTDDFMTAIAKGAGVPDLDQMEQRPQFTRSGRLSSRRSTARRTRLGLSGTPSIQVVGPGGKKLLPRARRRVATSRRPSRR